MYTYSTYDGYSAQLHPTTKRVTATMGSIPLLTQKHEIGLIQRVRDKNGVMVFNGQPNTRTLREYTQQGNGGSRLAGGRGGAGLHFMEDAEEARLRFTHLHTPITLNRATFQTFDDDVKYNASCGAKGESPTVCVGRDLYNHLDYAVLPYGYDNLWAKDDTPTVVGRMFPITPVSLHAGTIVGRERIITKVAGTFPAPSDAHGGPFECFLYNYSKPVGSGPSCTGSGPKVTVGPLSAGQIVIVVPGGKSEA